MFPKTQRKSRREQRKAAYPKARKAAREAAYEKDGGRCIWPTCKQFVSLESDNPYLLANGHELVARSQLGDPTDVTNVVILCWSCHMDLHTPIGGKKKRIIGARRGELVFEEKQFTGWVVVGLG